MINVSLTIIPGQPWQPQFTWQSPDCSPVDITGYTATLTVARAPGASEQYLTASTALGTITLGGALGTITVNVPGSSTAGLVFSSAMYVLTLTPLSGSPTILATGPVSLTLQPSPPSTVTPNTGTCSPWAGPSDLCEPCTDVAFDPTLLANCFQIASDVLFNLTGRQYPGLCTDTVRPTGRNIVSDHGRPVHTFGVGADQIFGFIDPAYIAAGAYGWWQGALGNQTERTGGYPVSEVTLGAYPVTSILQVLVNGQVVEPSGYRIDDNRWLVRLADPVTGAPRFWPFLPREDMDATQPNTFQVVFTYGTPPPPGGVNACAVYACQLALSASPKTVGQCTLPSRVKTINRQGINMALIDPMDFIDKGRTGLVVVDQWIRSVNPGGIPRRMTVSSPDIKRRVRRAGPHA